MQSRRAGAQVDDDLLLDLSESTPPGVQGKRGGEDGLDPRIDPGEALEETLDVESACLLRRNIMRPRGPAANGAAGGEDRLDFFCFIHAVLLISALRSGGVAGVILP